MQVFLALIVVSFSVAIFGVAKPTIIRSIDNSLEDISSKVVVEYPRDTLAGARQRESGSANS